MAGAVVRAALPRTASASRMLRVLVMIGLSLVGFSCRENPRGAILFQYSKFNGLAQ